MEEEEDGEGANGREYGNEYEALLRTETIGSTDLYIG